MTISILAFGIAKEIVGTPSAALQVDDATTVGTIKARLGEQYPRLQLLTSFMIAVNGEYAVADTVIKQGDEIAIIPPVSGG